MSPWTWRHVWPVVDTTTSYSEAVGYAGRELADVIEKHGLVYVGDVEWEMVENDREWPDTDSVLIAVAPVVPARPTPEQWPVLLAWFAEREWSDGRIAKLLDVPRDSVFYQRRKHGIPSGVPKSIGRAA